MSDPERRRLNSWKEISDYLDRDARTVARWEKERGLPTHRVPGGKGRSVFAYADELDGWLAGEASASDATGASVTPASAVRGSRLTLHLALGAALLALVAVAAWGLFAPAADLRAFEIRGTDLVGLDAQGRALWKHPFERRVVLAPEGSQSFIGDIDDDRRRELIVSLSVASGARELYESLYCFHEDGRVRWTRSPADAFTFRAGRYGAPWGSSAFIVYGSGAGRRIAWTTHHHTWWPSMLVTLDRDGQALSRFVNAGWMTALTVTPDGRHLLAGGWHNDSDGSMLAVLDAADPSGSSPERAGSPFECLTCPPGRPMRYFVMPRPELSRITRYRPETPHVHAFSSGTIEFRTLQTPSDSPPGEVIYEFSPAFEPVRASASDAYWEWHRRLEADGRLTHAAAACPERRGFTIRRWDAEAGWRDVHVRPTPGADFP